MEEFDVLSKCNILLINSPSIHEASVFERQGAVQGIVQTNICLVPRLDDNAAAETRWTLFWAKLALHQINETEMGVQLIDGILVETWVSERSVPPEPPPQLYASDSRIQGYGSPMPDSPSWRVIGWGTDCRPWGLRGYQCGKERRAAARRSRFSHAAEGRANEEAEELSDQGGRSGRWNMTLPGPDREACVSRQGGFGIGSRYITSWHLPTS
jgi:hypothetical protein